LYNGGSLIPDEIKYCGIFKFSQTSADLIFYKYSDLAISGIGFEYPNSGSENFCGQVSDILTTATIDLNVITSISASIGNQ
jgi:hypothetical protein